MHGQFIWIVYILEVQIRDIIDFCKGTGLHRHELEALEPGHILVIEDRVYVWVRQEKGENIGL